MFYCPLQKYKNILGTPDNWLHSKKVFGTAIIDYFLTILFSFIINFISGIPTVIITVILFTLGEILHMLFGVNTNTIKFLNLNCNK